MPRQLPKAGQRQLRTEIVRLTVASLTGSLATSLTAIPEGTYHCTAKKTSTGVYAVQLNSDRLYGRVPVVKITPFHASASIVSVLAGNTIAGLITVNCFTSSTGSPVDATELQLEISGSDVVDQI